MAKTLATEFQGEPINFTMDKIDRTKLYGWIDTEVVDENGKPCQLGTLLDDGHSLVLLGGAALAYLSQNGQWRKKSELRPVNPRGQLIPPVKSTFDSTLELSELATVEEYLSHNIHLIYQLTPESPCPAALMEKLKSGAIFWFPFSYRGGVVANTGFMLLGADGNIFMCVGNPTDIQFIGLRATAAILPDEEAAPAEDDSMDFSMV